MSVRIAWDGLDELRDGLRNLPEDLANQAAAVVRSAAMDATQEIKAAYPVRQTGLHPGLRRQMGKGRTPWFPPGNLRKGVTVQDKSTRVSAAYKVRSASPHAHLFEDGTGRRQTSSGANRGQMPKGQTEQLMIPKVIRIRKRMVDQLIAIVRSVGFEVNVS